MKQIKFPLVADCFLSFSSVCASVTFFNHYINYGSSNNNNVSIIATYKLYSPEGTCSLTYTKKDIQANTAYKGKNIQLSTDSSASSTYYQLFVTSLTITHSNKTTTTITIPSKTFPNGNTTTPCNAYENTGVLFLTFANSPSETFWSTGSG